MVPVDFPLFDFFMTAAPPTAAAALSCRNPCRTHFVVVVVVVVVVVLVVAVVVVGAVDVLVVAALQKFGVYAIWDTEKLRSPARAQCIDLRRALFD